MIKKLFKAVIVVFGVLLIVGIIGNLNNPDQSPEDSQPDTSKSNSQVSGNSDNEEDSTGLTKKEKITIYQAIVDAEERAEKASEEKYPSDAIQILRAGKTLRLTKDTRLMSELEPQNAMTATGNIVKLPPRTITKSKKESNKNGTPWFYVRAKTPQGQSVNGWINSTALIGQVDHEKLRPTLNKQIDYSRQVAKEYKAKIAEKHGLTSEQLQKIGIEVATKGWVR